MRFTVVLLPADEEGHTGYTALVPALGGIASEGETVAEALANVREAIVGYLEAITPEEAQLVCAAGEPAGTVVASVEVPPLPAPAAPEPVRAG